eukprot:9639295-Prorocentrum_lima.AAC.1
MSLNCQCSFVELPDRNEAVFTSQSLHPICLQGAQRVSPFLCHMGPVSVPLLAQEQVELLH